MARAARNELGVDEWIIAGLKALREGGVESVKVEPLARRLGVTKGSFYWHFENRDALLSAVLKTWERKATFEIIDAVETHGGTPRQRLWFLVDMCTTSGADRLESAVRAWAMNDRRARRVLKKVDQERQDFVAGILVEHGLTRAEAARRSQAVYLALVGEFTMVSHGGHPTSAAVWKSLLDTVLVTA